MANRSASPATASVERQSLTLLTTHGGIVNGTTHEAGTTVNSGAGGTGRQCQDTTFTLAQHGDPKTHVKAIAQCISGGLSSGVSMLFVYPMDAIKTKLQTFGHLYRGGAHILLVEWRAGGLRTIYRGLTPATLGACAESCACFASQGVWQDVVRSLASVSCTERMSPFQNMVAGNLTGVTVSLLMTPVELIKCRLQALREVAALTNKTGGHSSFPTPSQLTYQIYKTSRFRGLYTGFVGVFTKMTLGFGAMFGTYDLLRTQLKQKEQRKDEIGPLLNLVCGGGAGMAYWVIGYPLDLIKSRMQVMPLAPGQQIGFFRLCYQALQTEGIAAMYKGFMLTAVRAVTGIGIVFMIYEQLRTQLITLPGVDK